MNIDPYKKRLWRLIDKYGESFTLDGETDPSYRGIFHILDSTTVKMLLDDLESLSVLKPGLKLYTKAAVVLTRGQIVTRRGIDYKVKKSFTYAPAGEATHNVALLSPEE